MKGAYHKRYTPLALFVLFVDITCTSTLVCFRFKTSHMDIPLNVNIS